MDEFHAIAEDLSVWEHSAIRKASLDTLNAQPVPSIAAVSQLQLDLQQLAILVCIMTSAANALEKGSANSSLCSLMINFCPQQPFDARTKMAQLADTRDADQIAKVLHELEGRITFATMLTRHSDLQFRASTIEKHGIEILADAWRRTSCSILSAMMKLNDNCSTSVDAQKCARVLNLLEQCISGATPCLTADDQLEVPGWAERRNTARVVVNTIAQASTGGDYFDVAIINASSVGLGLAGDVEHGKHTTVLFDDGRRVSGTVRWSEDGRFGLQLDQPLANNDQLLVIKP